MLAAARGSYRGRFDVMAEFWVFIYALLSGFVLMSLQRNQRQQRPSPHMVTLAGWGLFSLSSTLAILMGALAFALAIGVPVPLDGLAPGVV